jgi:hypothetical protein
MNCMAICMDYVAELYGLYGEIAWTTLSAGHGLAFTARTVADEWALIALVVVSRRRSNVMPPDYDPGVVPAIHEARLQKDLRRSGLCT